MKEIFENLYRDNKTLWTVKDPPKELIDLIESRIVAPGTALDIGCGEGYFSIYLAKQGFEVTGIDFSETAISRAKKNAERAGVKCRFITSDTVGLDNLDSQFDFILEWGLLHCIMPRERQRYLSGVKKVLRPNGKYLSASFSWYDQALGGSMLKYRFAPSSGLWLYYSSHAELKQLFSGLFNILDSKLVPIASNSNYHSTGNYFLLQNKP